MIKAACELEVGDWISDGEGYCLQVKMTVGPRGPHLGTQSVLVWAVAEGSQALIGFCYDSHASVWCRDSTLPKAAENVLE